MDAAATLDPAERAREYERALRQSQSQVARRRGVGVGVAGSALMQSTRLGPGPGASTIFQSATASGLREGMDMAQTAVLGDSQGSVVPSPHLGGPGASVIPEEELAPDGGVGSGLGGSYVDGRRPQPRSSDMEREREEEGLEDGGVLGLLAQIYGTGVNLKGRGRGPPKAF